MRKRSSWIKPADAPIFEYIQDAGEVNPAILARNTDFHRKYASERCRALSTYSTLESLGKGYHRLTNIGEQYLEEELDAEVLRSTNSEQLTEREWWINLRV